MAEPLPPLVRRQRAVMKAQARFAGKSFLLGRRDCVRLAAAVLAALGHPVPKIPPYRTQAQARAALAAHGAATVADLLDGIGLPRIAPARAMTGDLLFHPGAEPDAIGSLCIALGNGAMLGFSDWQPGLVSLRPAAPIEAAWAVLP